MQDSSEDFRSTLPSEIGIMEDTNQPKNFAHLRRDIAILDTGETIATQYSLYDAPTLLIDSNFQRVLLSADKEVSLESPPDGRSLYIVGGHETMTASKEDTPPGTYLVAHTHQSPDDDSFLPSIPDYLVDRAFPNMEVV